MENLYVFGWSLSWPNVSGDLILTPFRIMFIVAVVGGLITCGIHILTGMLGLVKSDHSGGIQSVIT